jgi:hypothetical protein
VCPRCGYCFVCTDGTRLATGTPLSITFYGCSVGEEGVLKRIVKTFLAPKGVGEKIRLRNVPS